MNQNAQASAPAVAVIGGGLTGLSAALAIGRSGRPVHHVDPDANRHDARTTAMLGPTIDLLRQLGVWERIEPESAPLGRMRIIDGSRRLLRAPTTTFDASEIGQTEFGYNVPNAAAAKALRAAVAACDAITVHHDLATSIDLHEDRATLTLDGGTTFDVALVVGADGRNSIVRQAANIPAREWRYPQAALVTTFGHELPHRDTSTEFHFEVGPTTQVPLPGNRSSLVWMDEPAEIARVSSLETGELSPVIEERLAFTLGGVEVDGPIGTFPMSGMIAARYGGRRAMLVGEAAHAFPPIGAQGFNLSMRDVRDCVGVQRDAADPGEPALIAGYERMRAGDAQRRTLAVDVLNRSLLNGLLPVQAAKSLGLAALKALPPLRQVIMREGFRPEPIRSPSMAVGDMLTRLRQRAERARTVPSSINPAE